MRYLIPDDVTELHVEITNLCNAACPMCSRNSFGYGVQPNPGLTGWQSNDADLAFSDQLKNLSKVYFCGTHGDPLASDYLLDAVKACKRRGCTVEIFTNGSLRSPDWWRALVSLFDDKDKIVFGVDGIETNHLYRQNTSIDKILENMRICCASKVIVQWDFLAFKHNEHELEKCRNLAKEIGVRVFRVRKTARWQMNNGMPVPVRNRTGDITHYLEKPSDSRLVHPDVDKLADIARSEPKEYQISCIYQQAAKLYINCRMQVFPCCYISSDNEELRLNQDQSRLHVPIQDFSLREKSWQAILEHDFYARDLITSFGNGTALNRCIRTCGVVAREANQNEIFDDRRVSHD